MTLISLASNPNHQTDDLQVKNNNKNRRSRNRRRRRRQNKHHDDNSSVSSSDSSHQQQQPREILLSQSEKARYVAMDCEMVGVGYYDKSAVAQITIVNWNEEVIYTTYVRPDKPVTDYRTHVSGIEPHHLENALDFDTARQQVAELLQGKILVGHALKNDLHVLKLQHNWMDTRDTAKYEPWMKQRFDDGVLWPRKLSELCKLKLNLDIQAPGQSHSAFQDAVAALRLYKHAFHKIEKAMEYKKSKTASILAQQQAQQ